MRILGGVAALALAACGTVSTGGDVDAVGTVDAAAADAAPGGHVLLNSTTTLYRFDVGSGQLDVLGDVGFPPGEVEDGLSDIALSSSGELYGATYTTLYRIDLETRQAEIVGATPLRLYGLAFAPGPGGDETLYGAEATGQIVEIDRTTAGATPVQTLPMQYKYAGDLAWVPERGLLAVAEYGDVNDNALLLLNPQTDGVTELGATGVPNFFGLAYAGGALIGATTSGETIQIDPANGSVDPRGDTPNDYRGAASMP